MDRAYGRNPATDTDDIETLIGEVQASPTSNTVLDRLKTIATNLGAVVLTTGTAIIGLVKIAGHSSVLQGNHTMTGSAIQIHADTSCQSVTIQAHPDNAGYVYVGNSNVTSSVHMAVLSAGSSMTFNVSNLNLLYVNGTASDLVSYGGEV